MDHFLWHHTTNVLLWLQCYVQQLRQIRQDAQQLGDAPALSGPHKSGEADWSLLSPRAHDPQVNPLLALHLTRVHSGQHAPVMASTQVASLFVV